MENFNYEKSIKRLEEITVKLEKGELSLEEMIKLYTEGTEIAGQCSKALDEARIKISKLGVKSEND